MHLDGNTALQLSSLTCFILGLKGRQGLQVKEDNTKSTFKKGLNNGSCAA